MGLPMAIYKQLITDDTRVECDIIWPNKYVADFFLFYMIALIGACAIMGALAYCGIRRSLAKVQQIYNKERSRENVDQVSDDALSEQVLKISNLICVLISVFVICVFPFPLFVVLLESGVLENFRYNYVIYLATSCLLYGNCLANPLILMFMSRDARTALIEKRSSTRRNEATEHIRLEDA
jgi:cytochrome c biogenesis factor